MFEDSFSFVVLHSRGTMTEIGDLRSRRYPNYDTTDLAWADNTITREISARKTNHNQKFCYRYDKRIPSVW